MKLKNTRVMITGASGGIGRCLALQLSAYGARIALVGRRHSALIEVENEIRNTTGGEAHSISADLGTNEGRIKALNDVRHNLGRVDLLINSAGIVDFHEFNDQDPAMIDAIYQTNLIAPVQMTRAILPAMLEQGHGKIVNIGSIFGSIGFAYFAAYSSSKFALRGFSESLRRELDGTDVSISYIAPRAVKTAANSEAVYRMAAATKMNMDEPEDIARFIVNAIIKDKAIAYYGWPEKLFVRINSLLPMLVDGALRKQNRVMAQYVPKL